MFKSILGGAIGYAIGKFLDQTGVGRAVAKAGTEVLNSALTKFHEMTQGPVRPVPRQDGDAR